MRVWDVFPSYYLVYYYFSPWPLQYTIQYYLPIPPDHIIPSLYVLYSSFLSFFSPLPSAFVL
ncbi:hypothetical protein C2G38_2052628, partial [Gigaspora rosea]